MPEVSEAFSGHLSGSGTLVRLSANLIFPSLTPPDEPSALPLNDGERRCFEQQISELVQNAETKKAEIASQKIEIRHLKEQVRGGYA